LEFGGHLPERAGRQLEGHHVDTKIERLTDAVVKRLPVPAKGNRIFYDPTTPNFGIRITAGGHRSFICNYYPKGRPQRRYTIGSFPNWSTVGAREEFRKLTRLVDTGGDPLAEIEAMRAAPAIDDLANRFEREYLPRRAPNTQDAYRRALRLYIQPALGRMKVVAVVWADIDALHRKITDAGHPFQANRVVALLSKMFSLAVRWHMRPDNPVRGIERNSESPRHRYPTGAELARLATALDNHTDRQGAAVFRLCQFTGCRVGEALSARWDQFDLTGAGVWTKPGATTKQRTIHIVPLNTAARALLAHLRQRTNSVWVFPADSDTGHRVAVQKSWRAVCKAADIKDLRIHDLRHSFASQLVNAGASLPLIGALLGHTQAATTHRYAHLADGPQREAVERVGKRLTGLK
jgi:integrase